MSDARPAPMVPPDCDLRGMDWMPLYGHRLFGSELWMSCSDAAFRAALRLWWAAWQQCPASSLPNDEAALCRLADMGRDIRGWRRLQSDAMRGFIECSDGRLYHPLLAEIAVEAWRRRVSDRERKALWRNKKSSDVPRDATGTEHGRDADNACDVRVERTGQDRTEKESKEESTSLRSDAAVPAIVQPRPARDVLWSDGLAIVRGLTGKSEPQARQLLGRWTRDARDDCARVMEAIKAAADLKPGDPIAWLAQACRRPSNPIGDLLRAHNLDGVLPE